LTRILAALKAPRLFFTKIKNAHTDGRPRLIFGSPSHRIIVPVEFTTAFLRAASQPAVQKNHGIAHSSWSPTKTYPESDPPLWPYPTQPSPPNNPSPSTQKHYSFYFRPWVSFLLQPAKNRRPLRLITWSPTPRSMVHSTDPCAVYDSDLPRGPSFLW